MKLKFLAGAVALVAGSAFAAAPANITAPEAAGSENTYLFSVTSPVDYVVQGTFSAATSKFSFWGLYEDAGVLGNDGDDLFITAGNYLQAYTSATSLLTGHYYFVTTTPKVATFNVTFTPAVPEPETYAMMLAGLGAIGFMARRRRNG